MALGEILREFGVKVTLGFDGKKVEEAERRIEKLGSKMRSFALEMAAATAAVFESQNLFTSNARSLQNQADMLGLNTEELQQYEYAAKVAADVNREDLVSSLQQLGDTMDKARAGDVDARMALEKMGGAMGNQSMIIARLSDKTYKVTDAFRDMSAGISNISKASPQAARRLTEMTVGNAKLYNLLRQGPKAIDALTAEGKKNFALNEKMIRQGYEMDVQMSKLWMAFRKMGYEIGYSVMRHLGPMIGEFTKWFYANKKVIASGINAFLDTMADILKVLFQNAVMLTKALGPVVDALGGTKGAVNALITAFLVYKGLGIAGSFISTGAAIVGLLPSLSMLVTAFRGVGMALKAFGMVSALADLVPALALFGSGAAAALLPLLPWVAGLAAIAFAAHEIKAALEGGFSNTWTGQGLDKLKEGASWVASKVSPTGGAEAGPYSAATPSPSYAAAFAGGSPPVTQENHFSTTNTISIPHGTSAEDASAIISKANVDSHETLMLKAKMDAARSRVY